MFIYSLSSSAEPDNIRYIGKAKDLKDRLRRHIGKYYLENEITHKNNWIKSELSKGNLILIKEIEEVNEENWIEREIYWILKFKDDGYELTNGTSGGEGIILTKEVIKRRNESNKNSKKRKMSYINLKNTLEEKYLNSNKELIEMFEISCGISGKFFGNRKCPSCNESVIHKSSTLSSLICQMKQYILKGRVCQTCKSSGDKNYFYGKKLNDGKEKQEKYGTKILQYDLDDNLIQEFKSIREASEKTGIDRKSISNCAKGIKHYNTAGGFKFKIKE